MGVKSINVRNYVSFHFKQYVPVIMDTPRIQLFSVKMVPSLFLPFSLVGYTKVV